MEQSAEHAAAEGEAHNVPGEAEESEHNNMPGAGRVQARATREMENCTSLGEEASAAVLAAMRKVAAPESFKSPTPSAGSGLVGFSDVAGAEKHQSSILRMRRPTSRAFAVLVADMVDRFLLAGDVAKLFPADAQSVLEEVELMHKISQRSFPQVLEAHLRGQVQANEGRRLLRPEFRHSLMPMMPSSSHVTEMEALCKQVYGVELATVCAPVMFLHNMRTSAATEVRQLLGLAANPWADEAGATARPAAVETPVKEEPGVHGRGRHVKYDWDGFDGTAEAPLTVDSDGDDADKKRAASEESEDEAEVGVVSPMVMPGGFAGMGSPMPGMGYPAGAFATMPVGSYPFFYGPGHTMPQWVGSPMVAKTNKRGAKKRKVKEEKKEK